MAFVRLVSLCFNYHESDCCLRKLSWCWERVKGREWTVLLTNPFLQSLAISDGGIYLNSNQADKKNARGNMVLFICITHCLDCSRCQSKHQLPACLKIFYCSSIQKPSAMHACASNRALGSLHVVWVLLHSALFLYRGHCPACIMYKGVIAVSGGKGHAEVNWLEETALNPLASYLQHTAAPLVLHTQHTRPECVKDRQIEGHHQGNTHIPSIHSLKHTSLQNG